MLEFLRRHRHAMGLCAAVLLAAAFVARPAPPEAPAPPVAPGDLAAALSAHDWRIVHGGLGDAQ